MKFAAKGLKKSFSYVMYSVDSMPVDYMGGLNSYYSEVNSPVPGFTTNFNFGGYAYGSERKKHMLSKEGLKINNDKISDFKKNLFRF